MVRKCSHCGNIGHNSRTCHNHASSSSSSSKLGCGNTTCGAGIRLFGVHLDAKSSSSWIPIKKSFSLDCLSLPPLPPSSSSSPSSSLSSLSHVRVPNKACNGYLSDDPFGRAVEKRKGVPWTEDEHHTFLIGLEKLGKGDWRGISRKYVTTRTPTQVASHAQKYFLRQNNTSSNNKKRRSSLFDMEVDANNASLEAASSKRRLQIDLNSLEQADIENYNQDFQMQNSIKSPELELTLSGQTPLIAQNESSPTSRLVGPISVT